MEKLNRYKEKEIKKRISGRQSFLLLGPRQTGKTTLCEQALKRQANKIEYWLSDPTVRLELEKDPGSIIRRIEDTKAKKIVFINEAQKVPEIFDSAQYLIDKNLASFIFTGSSARKLRRGGANLLPGRIRKISLDPLSFGEIGLLKQSRIKDLAVNNINHTGYTLNDYLVYGSLPQIIMSNKSDRADLLSAYTEIYLEEEIRAEALSRKIGAFGRFLELAAAESGGNPNLTKLSNSVGVSSPAIKEFYNILEDTLIVDRIDPYIINARKRIVSNPRYYFFDLGVRNILARLTLDNNLVNAQKGSLFEHAIIQEILRRVRILNKNYKVYYWRTYYGAEVDCIIDTGAKLIPIEIKAHGRIGKKDISGLVSFMAEYKDKAKEGYVITMGKYNEKITGGITAVPWFNI